MLFANFKKNNFFQLTLITSVTSIFLFISLFYPGLMSSDSYYIYQSAKLNLYSDHHPPMMAYLWHFFLYLKDGPEFIYLFNMLMLWGGCMIIAISTLQAYRWQFIYFLIPFIPHVILYAGWIWKDNIFTFGYLLLSTWLAYKDTQGKKFSLIGNIAFFILLIYSTSVKYQAQFILPILLTWYISIQFDKALFPLYDKKVISFIKIIFISIILSLFVNQGIKTINNFLITQHGHGSDHAWQYKMIYDLAGISVNINQLVIPDFLIKENNLTPSFLQNHYTLAWEPLITSKDSPLRATQSNDERLQLQQIWKKMIWAHPIAYLKHRLYMWSRGILLSSPVKGFLMEKFPDNFFIKKFSWIFSFFAYIFVFPIQLYFLISSAYILVRTGNKFAKASFFMSAMGLALLFILLFFTLASVPRYIYFTNVMFFFSIPFFIAAHKYK